MKNRLLKPCCYLLILFFCCRQPLVLQAQQQHKPIHKETDYPEAYQLILPKLIPYRLGKLWGYADTTGTIKINPQFSFAEPFRHGVAIVHKANTLNLLNESGNLVFNREHRKINIWEQLAFTESLEHKQGVYTLQGREIVSPEFISAFGVHVNGSPFIIAWNKAPVPVDDPGKINEYQRRYELFSLFTTAGKPVLPEEVNGIEFLGGGIIETHKKFVYSYYNLNGELLPAFSGYRVGKFRNGLATIYRDGKFGVTDSTGNILVQPQFEAAKEFSEGKLAVKRNGKWGFIDKNGKELTLFKYEEANPFSKGFAVVRTGVNQYGLLNEQGNEATEMRYSYIHVASPGQLFAFNTNGVITYGFRHKGSGKIVIPPDLAEIKSFSEGLAVAVKGAKKGYIDENGNTVIPFDYQGAEPVKNGLAAVHNGKGWGAVNLKNETVIPFAFYGVEVITPDRFAVWVFNSPSWGLKALMNTQCQEIAPLKYTYITSLEIDRLMVQADDRWGIIDLNGRELMKPLTLPAGYKATGGLKNGIIQVNNKETNKAGFADWKGRIYFKDVP